MSKQEFLDKVKNLLDSLNVKEQNMLSLTGLYDQVLEHVVEQTRDDRDDD